MVVIMIMGQCFVQGAELWADPVSVTVTATVPSDEPPEEPDTVIIFQGLAYPGTNVTISQDGNIIAIVPSDPNARFDVSAVIEPGSYTFSVTGEDSEGRISQPFNITVTLSVGTTTTITGIFLGPTIDIDNISVPYGDTVNILGTTVPFSNVTVLVSSVEISTFQVVADDDGLWSKAIIAVDPINVGSHSARSKATAPDESISEFSATVNFEVTEVGEEEPDPCAAASLGDLNCDGSVNLVDFSILMYYWQSTNPANTRADINEDGIVDVIDFSIMLYYWTG